MRTPFAALALAVTVTGCRTSDFAGEFDAALRELPADGRVLLVYRAGRLRRYTVSIDPTAVPTAARRTSDEFVQPGGRTVFTGREWGEVGDGFRFVKEFGRERSWRSLLVGPGGEVLERSHQIPLAECPEAALATATATVAGQLVGVGVVQRNLRSPDRYRFEIHTTDRRRWYVVTDGDGRLLEHGREVGATLYSGQ